MPYIFGSLGQRRIEGFSGCMGLQLKTCACTSFGPVSGIVGGMRYGMVYQGPFIEARWLEMGVWKFPASCETPESPIFALALGAHPSPLQEDPRHRLLRSADDHDRDRGPGWCLGMKPWILILHPRYHTLLQQCFGGIPCIPRVYTCTEYFDMHR